MFGAEIVHLIETPSETERENETESESKYESESKSATAGSSTLTCNSDLEWDEEVPVCVKHTCETWTCPDETYCVWEDNLPHCWPGW